MEKNISLWDMYDSNRLTRRKDYIDPLYKPYATYRKGVEYHTGRKGEINANGWKEKIDAEIKESKTPPIYPELQRRGWGVSHQRLFSTDPCPMGFTPGADGWCYQMEPEHEPLFYTKDARVAQDQFFDTSNGRYAKMKNGDMLLF